MQDRRLRPGEHPLRRILAMWGVVSLLLLATGWTTIATHAFPDPDDVLRLVQVRDLLAGQGWFDLKQHRIDPLGTVPMHWSRLVDLPLAGMIALLAPLLGQGLAEQVTVIAVPFLTLLVAMVFMGRIAWRLFDLETAGLACLAMGFLPLLLFQFQPLRIDHHGWQIAMVALATWAIFLRQGWRGGMVTGLAMAVGTSISVELLPIAALFGGVLALRWLADHGARAWLVSYLASFAAGLGVLLLATRGLADLAPYCDAITLAHVGLFAVIAVGVALLSLFPVLPKPALALGLAVAGAAGIAVFALGSPECLRTPFGALDPVVRDFWYVNVPEGQPIWKQSADFYPALLPILLALAVALHLWRGASDWRRQWWFEYALLLGGLTLLGLLVWRSMAFASLLAAVPLGHVIARGLALIRSDGSTPRKLAVALGLVLVLLPTVPFNLVRKALADPSAQATNLEMQKSTCELDDSARKLSALPQGTVLAPLDIGPSILQYSPHAVVATGHHRAELAMRDVILAFTGTPERARRLIEKHEARYVVMCRDLIEPDIYVKRGLPGSFALLLRDGEVPAWLEPVALDTPPTFRVWRVRPDGTSAPPR